MLTMETAVIAFVDFNHSNCDKEGQSYPVECYLESVEEYSEGKIHMSEPESGIGLKTFCRQNLEHNRASGAEYMIGA